MAHAHPTPVALKVVFETAEFKMALNESRVNDAIQLFYKEALKLKPFSHAFLNTGQIRQLLGGIFNAQEHPLGPTVTTQDGYFKIIYPVNGDTNFTVDLYFDGSFTWVSSQGSLPRTANISTNDMVNRILGLGYYPILG